jgi:putative ABC transport system permease protein
MHDLRLSWIARLVRRARWAINRQSIESAMDDEMRYHVDREIDERVRGGMNPGEARRTALRDFGGIESYKEAGRDARGFSFIDDLGRDAAYAMRVLRHHPGFTAAVMLTLALGIGCTSAIFSLVNAILVRPLPYAAPDRLAALWERNDARKVVNNVVSVWTFETWRSQTHSFSAMHAIVPNPVTLDGDPAEHVTGTAVTPGYFAMLGVYPQFGRDFTPEEERDGGASVVILSDGLWRSRYGAKRDVVGRTIGVDGKPFTIVGVMPPGFDPPKFGWIAEQPLWIPFGGSPANRSWGRVLQIVARLKPGVSLEQAGAELAALHATYATEAGVGKGWSTTIVPLDEQIVGEVRKPLLVLFAAVVLLLSMAVVNVASLVTAFTRGRLHELAVRRTMGASPARLIRQQLVQNFMLGAGGAVVGLLIAGIGTRALVALVPPSVPRLSDVQVNGAVVLFATVVGLAATLCFGIGGALRAVGATASPTTMNIATTRVTARFSGGKIIAIEMAIGLVLTVLATLMVRSFANLRDVDLGFDARSAVAGHISLTNTRYPDDERRRQFFSTLMERVRAIPGVTNASLVTRRPFACCAPSTAVRNPNGGQSFDVSPTVDIRFADDTYFETMRIPVVAGRVFDRAERPDAPIHAVISTGTARQLWGNESPIGRTLSIKLFGTMDAEVIGVVGDVHLVDPRRPTRPTVYLSTERYPSSDRDVVLRGKADPNALIAALRDAVRSVDPHIPLANPTTLERSVDATLAEDRFTTFLLGGFALLALTLAAIGVYGVLAGDVLRRRKEIGIRLALGARPFSVAWLVLTRVLRPAAVGATIGVGFALAISRSMSALVFGVRTWDPASFALVTCTLPVIAVLATWMPARRAARESPMGAIRVD